MAIQEVEFKQQLELLEISREECGDFVSEELVRIKRICMPFEFACIAAIIK